MVFDYPHKLPVEDARARLEALSEYLTNRHGIQVTWDGDSARINGKYMVVKIEGEMTLTPTDVKVKGKDPGMLWRKKAKDYLHGKLAKYLDPNTALADLPRSR